MARTAQVQETATDTVAEAAVLSKAIQDGQPSAQDITELVNNSVANALASALPAVMQELMKSVQAQTPNFGNVPSPVVNVSLAPAVDVKPTYLKHYRMDGTVSGKYQMIDVQKLNEGASIGDAAIKGRWIHFASDHFYTNDQKEVDFIEWMVKTYGLPIYEDAGSATSIVRCPVDGCSQIFGDPQTLSNHLKATHGVVSPNA